MFINFIKDARKLNRIDLSSVKGKRMYYNKVRNSISLAVFVGLYVLFAMLSFSLEKGREFPIICVCAAGLFLVFYLFGKIWMFLLKNPVFILQGDRIYYLLTNEWYPIMEYDFRDEYIGKHNYYATFCMFDKTGKRIISEKNWHLKDEEEFKSHLKYNKLILARERSNNR